MGHKSWIVVTGFLWALIGCTLLYKGLHFISLAALTSPAFLSWFGEGERGATTLVGLGLVVGFIKGRFVLSKTVRRVTGRILSLPLPIRFNQVYGLPYLILIASMVFLGFCLRFVPIDIRGFVDVAVGSALLNGAMLYFRAARAIRYQHN